jgi:hypothetical protein
MLQKIVGYRQDESQDWIAELGCGHSQHVRHNPPFTNRLWITTLEGRASFVGHELECRLCDQTLQPPVEPPLRT